MLFCTLVIILIHNCASGHEGKHKVYTMTYEYGEQENGMKLSYNSSGVIPVFTPRYLHVINPSDLRPDLEQVFSYMKVVSVTIISRIHVLFKPETMTIEFYVPLPFDTIPYEVQAFAFKPIHKFGFNVSVDFDHKSLQDKFDITHVEYITDIPLSVQKNYIIKLNKPVKEEHFSEK